MTISTIRKATAKDSERVHYAAEAFAARHRIRVDRSGCFDETVDAEMAIDYAISDSRPDLRHLWAACYCRALAVPRSVRVTIAYGHVGVRCE